MTEGKIIALSPEIVKRPVVQKPISITSPLPKEGRIPKITETVFQWPGMGFLFIQAVQFVDIPIMSAYLVFIAFIFVMINFVVDILYYFIDPRIRVKSGDING